MLNPKVDSLEAKGNGAKGAALHAAVRLRKPTVYKERSLPKGNFTARLRAVSW